MVTHGLDALVSRDVHSTPSRHENSTVKKFSTRQSLPIKSAFMPKAYR